MTEPTKEQINEWREKFKKLSFYKVNGIDMPLNTEVNESGQFESVSTDFIWMGYLAAKKSDFEEIKTLKEQLAEAVALMKTQKDCIDHLLGKRESFGDSSTVGFGTRVDAFLEKQDKDKQGE